MAGGWKDRGLYDGRNVYRARMWLEVVWWTQCIRSMDVAGGRGDRGLYDGRNASGVTMGLDVGATEESMVEAMYKEPGCGWR